MCLYFLSYYIRLGEIPERLVDINIASDYSKIGKMLDLCKGEKRLDILRKTVQGETITNTIMNNGDKPKTDEKIWERINNRLRKLKIYN